MLVRQCSLAEGNGMQVGTYATRKNIHDTISGDLRSLNLVEYHVTTREKTKLTSEKESCRTLICHELVS